MKYRIFGNGDKDTILLLHGGGLSLGGQVALEMLAQRGDICENAVIESALVIPSKVTAALLPSSLKMSYGLIQKEWFARKQFAALRIPEEFFEDYFRDTKEITLKNMTAFLTANQQYELKSSVKDTSARVYVFAGGKEIKSVKRSAEMINKAVKGSSIEVLDGMYHGEFSMKYAERYADKIIDICGGK